MSKKSVRHPCLPAAWRVGHGGCMPRTDRYWNASSEKRFRELIPAENPKKKP
jgi:hypothetical protein